MREGLTLLSINRAFHAINNLYFFTMKPIVVPTDFSPSADNAMNYAARLAEKLEAAVLLLHVYQIPVSMNDVPVMMVSVEELRNSAEKGLERVREQLQSNFRGLEVKTESRLGDIVQEMEDVCREWQPLAIVVGKHGASGVERFLFGSTTLSLIRHAAVPVISVPDTATAFSLEHIALALDDHPLAPAYRKVIESFIQDPSAPFFLVHVQQGEKDRPVLAPDWPGMQPVSETIRDDQFVHGIEAFVKKHAIDMLIILPHKHSAMERFFFRTHTTDLIQKLRIPIMCIPEQKN